ncbi:hypothetical protein [Lentibacillus sp. CBA3610]|uniref:hypothetical protein n=1 Tax=Lentibacillus sp. CBA3610 TaxID=2518176 RepID=UPI00159619CF|nr:hypothetical protein [Lentibacillus sp. CBA3610]
MWDDLLERLPEIWVLMGAGIVFAVPFTIYKVNQKLHKLGDPPWKKRDNQP